MDFGQHELAVESREFCAAMRPVRNGNGRLTFDRCFYTKQRGQLLDWMISLIPRRCCPDVNYTHCSALDQQPAFDRLCNVTPRTSAARPVNRFIAIMDSVVRRW